MDTDKPKRSKLRMLFNLHDPLAKGRGEQSAPISMGNAFALTARQTIICTSFGVDKQRHIVYNDSDGRCCWKEGKEK